MTVRVFTIDTAASPWMYSTGIPTTVSGTAETFELTFDDTGDGGKYCGGGTDSSFALADGNTLTIEQDNRLTCLWHEANGAVLNPGSIWVRINGGPREEVKVVASNITDGDGVGANNLASITFEYPGRPFRWTWTNIDMA